MGSLVVINGRVTYVSKGYRAHRSPVQPAAILPRDKHGDPVDTAPITRDRRALASGLVARDAEEDVTYCVVKRLDALHGWAGASFWLGRWQIRHDDLLFLVRRGLLQAAVEEGSLFRYYRPVDERLLLESTEMQTIQARAKIRGIAKKT